MSHPLRDTDVHYRLRKSPLLVPILAQKNPAQILQSRYSYRIKIFMVNAVFPFSVTSRQKPTQFPVHWALAYFVGKTGETRCWPPALLWCPCYKWVELYLYSQYWRFCRRRGRFYLYTLHFIVIFIFLSPAQCLYRPWAHPHSYLAGLNISLILSTSRNTHRFCKQQVVFDVRMTVHPRVAQSV